MRRLEIKRRKIAFEVGLNRVVTQTLVLPALAPLRRTSYLIGPNGGHSVFVAKSLRASKECPTLAADEALETILEAEALADASGERSRVRINAGYLLSVRRPL